MPKRPNTEANGARKSKKRARKAKESSDKEDTTADNPMNVQDRSDEESENDVVDATEQVKAAREAEEKQINKDLARRKSAVYAFFDANPEVEFDKSNEAEYIVYRCTKCKEKMRQGWKTGDKGSTGMLSQPAQLKEHKTYLEQRQHERSCVRRCWGEEALAAIKDSTLEQARAGVKELSKGKQTTLTAIITTVQTWYKTYSTRPPDKEKIRVVTARWVAESARPFHIVQDRSFRWLQKEGRPTQYVPSKETVGRDVKVLYAAAKTAEAVRASRSSLISLEDYFAK
ncbi:hypothetical protein F5880DRAFT_1679948 [Lentinula raphanica]|nr:hypothetical protein F5880DRAFT_1679948 [Lentinula raphanica]